MWNHGQMSGFGRSSPWQKPTKAYPPAGSVLQRECSPGQLWHVMVSDIKWPMCDTNYILCIYIHVYIYICMYMYVYIHTYWGQVGNQLWYADVMRKNSPTTWYMGLSENGEHLKIATLKKKYHAEATKNGYPMFRQTHIASTNFDMHICLRA